MYRRLHIERTRIAKRLGRRGLLLILMGLSWIGLGVSNLAIPSDRFSSPGLGNDTVLQILDGPGISALWVIGGGAAFIIGLFHDRRIMSKHESIGWNAVLTLPLMYVSFFTWSFVVNVVTNGEEGRPQSLYGSIVWTLVSVVIMIMAGWPEERDPRTTPEE